MKGEDMSRRALDVMDRLNKKHCQDELERIKNNIYPDTKFDCGNCPFSNPDRKTAFLTELAKLLRKYNAVINVGWDDFDEDNYPKIDMDIVFGDGSGICFESVLSKSLTPDNIFDYEKG